MNLAAVQKSGKNQGRYLGETIRAGEWLEKMEFTGARNGWTGELIAKSENFPVKAWHLPARVPSPGNLRVYISAGIHGDEPAGPLAAHDLMAFTPWPDNVELWILPCLNPGALEHNRRENAQGLDLNRDFRDSKTHECRSHVAWLERQKPWDIYFCLHEDWESHGFYLYEQNPDDRPSLAEWIIQEVGKVCPIDLSENIEGRTAHNGIIRPNIHPLERPDWPEAFYLISHKSRQGYTLEAPSDFPLPMRVRALTTAVLAGIHRLAGLCGHPIPGQPVQA